MTRLRVVFAQWMRSTYRLCGTMMILLFISSDCTNPEAELSLTPGPSVPKPIARFEYTVSGGMHYFLNKSENATRYQWEFCGGTSSTEESPVRDFSAYSSNCTVTLTAFGSGRSDKSTVTFANGGGYVKPDFNRGTYSFFTKSDLGYGFIKVSLNGVYIGDITRHHVAGIVCGANDVLTIKREPGTYTLTAKGSNGGSWNGNVTFEVGTCKKLELTK